MASYVPLRNYSLSHPLTCTDSANRTESQVVLRYNSWGLYGIRHYAKAEYGLFLISWHSVVR